MDCDPAHKSRDNTGAPFMWSIFSICSGLSCEIHSNSHVDKTFPVAQQWSVSSICVWCRQQTPLCKMRSTVVILYHYSKGLCTQPGKILNVFSICCCVTRSSEEKLSDAFQQCSLQFSRKKELLVPFILYVLCTP
jgi:hypothetical protein